MYVVSIDGSRDTVSSDYEDVMTREISWLRAEPGYTVTCVVPLGTESAVQDVDPE